MIPNEAAKASVTPAPNNKKSNRIWLLFFYILNLLLAVCDIIAFHRGIVMVSMFYNIFLCSRWCFHQSCRFRHNKKRLTITGKSQMWRTKTPQEGVSCCKVTIYFTLPIVIALVTFVIVSHILLLSKQQKEIYCS